MKVKELRGFNLEELKRREDELRRELLDLRIRQATQQLKNPLGKREIRREIARILTLIAEKEKR